MTITKKKSALSLKRVADVLRVGADELMGRTEPEGTDERGV